jgi:hypothetical protein
MSKAFAVGYAATPGKKSCRNDHGGATAVSSIPKPFKLGDKVLVSGEVVYVGNGWVNVRLGNPPEQIGCDNETVIGAALEAALGSEPAPAQGTMLHESGCGCLILGAKDCPAHNERARAALRGSENGKI